MTISVSSNPAQNTQVLCVAVNPKKSKAPKRGAAICAGVGAASGLGIIKFWKGTGMFEGLSKKAQLGIKSAVMTYMVAVFALTGLLTGAFISLFTKNKRQQLAVDEYNSKLNTKG